VPVTTRAESRLDGGMIGLLHPGEMGSAVGARLHEAGHEVGWASEGRSAATKSRAEAAALIEVGRIADLARASDVVLSICPPHAAVDVARAVAEAGFAGTYVDANAIAPTTTRDVAEIATSVGATFVDGGIVGAPPFEAGTTRLYLSGPGADPVAALFDGSVVRVVVLDDRIGSASGLKMAYAAWTKGHQALLLSVAAVAHQESVAGALRQEWEWSLPELPARLQRAEGAADRKGWRWVGEMEEIAKTFDAAGEPSGFHEAAAEVFRRHPHPEDG